jgi:murein DD-endopeptidase MepM/ murein hydrolase activator NlpD
MLALSACTFMHPPQAYFPNRSGITPGETIVVKGNENVYTIAHEHNVSMRELIVLNDLKAPFEVTPGQKLVLPATDSTFAGDLGPPEASPLEPVEKRDLNPVIPAAVATEELEAPAAAPAAPAVAPKPAPASEGLQGITPPLLKQTATTAPAEAEAPMAMRWPVQGPILSNFGAKGPGLGNDGINIGAPKGSPVVASAPGTVVYAGDDMKGFGNLVLIRHKGDMVTAYAHLDRVLVKKDTVVGQGDMIGTVGKTGNVTSPQLHFEIRQDNKPVDPAQIIKSAL